MSRKQKNIEKNEGKVTKKKHGFFIKIIKFLLVIILLIICAIGGFVGYSVYKNGWGIKSLIQTAVGSNTPLEEMDEFQVLVLGVSEDIAAPLTDTIMIASYNPKTQKAALLSIPRDTFVGNSKLNANSYDKINAIYQVSGPEGALAKINELTGLNIEKYVLISNNALVELVDEIGGVEFDVPIDMNYDSKKQNLHIHLKAGYQKLDGEQAEWLVRFRKNNNGTTYSYEYGDNDYGRMKTQREFLRAVAKQTLQAKNITKIGAFIDIVKKNVQTNINDWDEIKDYIPYLVEFNAENIKTATLPGDSQRIPEGTGLWFFLADDDETKLLVDDLIISESDVTAKDRAKIKIEVLNGSGKSSNLNKVINKLKAKGYNVLKNNSNTTETSKTIIMNKTNVSNEFLEDIQRILGKGIIQNSSSENNTTENITIIIGEDYDDE